MRSEPSKVNTAQSRSRSMASARRAAARKHKARRAVLESLEVRSLLATLPPAIVSNQIVATSGIVAGDSNSSSPSIVVDPRNENNLVAVWQNYDPVPNGVVISIQGAYSTNGGTSWNAFTPFTQLSDPTTSNPTVPYTRITDGTVDMDRNGNVYVLASQHNDSNASGALTLSKFSFNNGFLTPQFRSRPVYSWTQDQALKPTLAVDKSVAVFNDSYVDANGNTVNTTQTNPTAGNVYIAWGTVDVAPPNVTNWNPNTIKIIGSSNGGQSFGGAKTVGQGNFGSMRETAPRIITSQGTAAGTTATVAGGTVNIVWDDFGSGANASPTPFDLILGRNYTGLNSQSFSAAPGGITDPPSGATATTNFPINVNFAPNTGNITDLTVSLAIQHPALAEIGVSLRAPDGTTIQLISTGAATGANLGYGFGGASMLSTQLSQSGSKSIANGAAPYLGTFRPSQSLAAFNGPIQNGVWTIVVTDGTNNNVGFLWNGTLSFTSGFVSNGINAIAQTAVRGDIDAGGVVSAPATPQGIGPAPMLAADNTLGGASPNQGRLYLTYVDRYDPNAGYTGNPADNTDIFLAVSDDGGNSWFNPATGFGIGWGYDGLRVNDDNALVDGFSEANYTLTDPNALVAYPMSGRPQFLPTATVDQATGTLVVSYYDTRFDAAKARYATMLTSSIDGGGSFAKSTFANTALQPFDQATNEFATLGPIPDNVSGGNNMANKDTVFYYGDRAGLAASNGKIYPAWSSNLNGGTNGRQLLQIRVAQATIAAGPRIISGTMGPVGEAGDTLNNTRAADGAPQAQSVIVVFDRPVDPNTFTPNTADFRILGRDVNGNNLAVQPTVTAVTPLDNGRFGATQFRIDFTAALVPGTYSYAVGPTISDRIRQADALGTVISTGNAMDQNSDANPDQSGFDEFSAPGTINGNPFSAPYVRDQLPLVVPGPHVVSWQMENEVGGSGDHLVRNQTTTYVDVTFDRDMNPASFTPSQVLRIQGPAGLVTGNITVTPVPIGANPARTFRITFPKQELSGTYTIELGSGITSASGYAIDSNLNAGVDALRGVASSTASLKYNSTGSVVVAPGTTRTSSITVPDNFILQGLTLQLNITSASDPDLTAWLVAPDGTEILLFQNVGRTGTQANFNNTIFDDNATTPIANGGPPFFGRFRPQQPLSVLNGSLSVGGPNGTGSGVYTLKVTNAATGKATTINNWSITLAKPLPSTGLGELVADRTQLAFRIFTMDPTNPLSSTTWTSVGPASIGGGSSGRIGGLAIDPSDPSGNTVYVGGASGGVWKTKNFLTTDPLGPTYIPLTDFGPTSGINIGGIAVFGRNNDPNQSIIFVSTGEGDTTSRGVGVLRSMDGGATWTLLDSTNNNLPFAARDHAFVNSTSYKILVDPKPSPSGQVIVYMALSGNNGGIWRSVDSGQTWGVVNPTTGQRTANLPGQATDVVLDPVSGPVDAVNNPTGNLQIIYAAIRGQGVYISPNQGQVWSIMTGGVGNPLIQDPAITPTPRPIAVGNLNVNPNGPNGRIVLAKPDAFPSSDPNATLKNFIYQGWLYAAVATPNGNLQGLYVTKDQGQNWTRIRIPNPPPQNNIIQFAPSNNTSYNDFDVIGSPTNGQGNYNITLIVDPTNPNIVYLGGMASGNPTGLIRIDITGLSDPHSFYLGNDRNDGGTLMVNGTDAMTMKQNPLPGIGFFDFDPRSSPTINLIRDPASPLGGNSTFYVNNVTQFANSGAGARWIGFDDIVAGTTDQHRVIAFRDPLTGHARFIYGDDQGVFTGVDTGDGTLSPGIGTSISATGSRNGNLQITQFYYGAVQPSSAAAQIAGAMFYGQAQDNGSPVSDPDILNNGNIYWSGPGGDGTGVATDQTGSGTSYRYNWPCCGGNTTDFFQVVLPGGIVLGRTNGLIQQSGGRPVPDPQWPYIAGFNFGLNPVNGNQIVISSAAGRIFRTLDQGNFWQVIAEPSLLDGTNAPALTFGAPDPGATAAGQLGNFIYAGTQGGHIYVTFTGGGGAGGAGNAWYDITTGDLLGNTAPVRAIVANPTRGSREAFAVTSNGVYYISDSNPNSGAVWQNITSNLFQFQQAPFGLSSLSNQKILDLTSIVADWRYVIPDSPTSTSTHPMLYVAGEGGVYRSSDKGASWTLFPEPEAGSINTTPPLPSPGGALPNARVNDLDLSLGNVDPTTGRSVAAPGDPNLLVATTFGRGSFAIRLAPVVFANQIALSKTLPQPGGSANGTASDGTPLVTVAQPFFEGLSQQTAFGHVVRITIWDYTDPANPRIIGGYDPANPLSDNATNYTDSFGKYSVQVNAGGFTTNGLKTVGIQATDLSGTKGNVALFTFTLRANLSNVNQPPAVPTIAMDPADDTSGGQLITRTLQPDIIGITDPNVTVQLFMSDNNPTNPSPIGLPLTTGVTNNLGNYSLTFPNLGDGTYYVQVVATNTFGSSKSSVLKFQVKNTAPTVVPTLGLLPANDTGLVGDNVTSFRTPNFVGTAEAGARVQLYRVINGVRSTPLSTVTADPVTGAYSIQLPFALSNGTLQVQVGETDIAGNQGPYSPTIPVTIVTTAGDYTSVGKTTPTLFRRSASGNAQWFTNGAPPSGGWTVSGNPATGTKTFGSSTLDIPFQGDFDGDGVTDTATYRPSTNTWTIVRSAQGTVSYSTLGATGDIPTVGDFDGDGVTDTAMYRSSNGQWAIARSLLGTVTLNAITTPATGDLPVPGNYDNTGTDELALYRPSNGTFYILGPSGLYTKQVFSGATPSGRDVPVPGDYSNSFTVVNGVPVASRPTLPAVYNPATGVWVIAGQNGNFTVSTTGFQSGDIPAPGDYTGSGSLQQAVYRPSAGKFFLADGTLVGTIGTAGDVPTNAPLPYRNLVNQPTLALATTSNTAFNDDLITSGRFAQGTRWLDFTGKTDPGASVDILNLNAGGIVVGTAVGDPVTGNYNVSVEVRYNGTYNYAARTRNIAGAVSTPSPTVTVRMVTVTGDYVGVNAKTTQDLFSRVNPFQINWNVQGYSTITNRPFGAGSVDVPIAADIDADGKSDLLLYRPSTATWFAQRSAFGYVGTVLGNYGWAGVDIPAVADYNGDGMSDIAVFRPAIGSGTDGYWYIAIAGAAGFTFQPIAVPRAGDVPVPGDYDGVGHDEPALFRPSTTANGNALWIISDPFGAGASGTPNTRTIQFGAFGTVPVPGNYVASSGDTTVEPAVFNPTTGLWSIRVNATTTRNIQFAANDIPAPGDYNGDGITDPVVFRPSTGQWLVAVPGSNTPVTLPAGYGTSPYGTANDIPVLAPYRYRQVGSSGGAIVTFGAATNGGSSAASLDLGSSARNLSSGSSTGNLTPTPAPAPKHVNVNLHTPVKNGNRFNARLAARLAARRQAMQQADARKNPGQLF